MSGEVNPRHRQGDRIFASFRCCRSSVVEHSLGKGEVHSSILCGSTSQKPIGSGQELDPESYAICKTDMLIKGQAVRNEVFGSLD